MKSVNRLLFKRFFAFACLAALLTFWTTVPLLLPAPSRAQVRSTYDEGAVGLGMWLRRLQTTASVLHTGAHPDDEDSALIARLARSDGARVGYLSLTRGDGGQNLIGPELFEPLGVIRTEELLQARKLDGGEQFFTRAFDFGFTKSRAETAQKWDEREILADMVRVIRTFRPLVIVSRFTGAPADGHGHHQFAGHLTPLAFRAAADPKEFPEQLAEGLRTWQARKLYVSARVSRESEPQREGDATMLVKTGQFDPLFGQSAYEIAMRGRSQHKSQGEGRLELHGPQFSGVRAVGRAPDFTLQGEGESDIFAGLPITLTSGVRALGFDNAELIELLQKIEEDAKTALEKFNGNDPRTVIAALNAGLSQTRQARQFLANMPARQTNNEQSNLRDPDSVRADAELLLARKEQEFTEALRLATGVMVDVLADAETVAPGESFNVTARVFFPEESPVEIKNIRLRAPGGWQVRDAATQTTGADTGPPTQHEVARRATQFHVTVPADARLTQPYWLRQPREGFLFKPMTDAPRGEPFAPALIHAEVELSVGDTPLLLTAPIEYRTLDPARGELRRELNVVPALSVAIDPSLVIVPTQARRQPQRVVVRLSNNSQGPLSGRVRLRMPPNAANYVWQAQPADAPFALQNKGERAAFTFDVSVAAPRAEGNGNRLRVADSFLLGAEAVTADGRKFDRTQRVIAYPHIQTHRLYTAAEAIVKVFDLKVAPVRVGYVMGSGDEAPEAIRRMGLQATLLDENDLSIGDLSSRFDTIVVGVRASQTRPDFVANNGRLLDFVRRGGALIVQYQRPDYAERGLPPLPAKMQEPGGIARVTDESAPVRVLQPTHPAFNFPNKITNEDWQGWVQERNLYNFITFDPAYVTLLESHDANEPANNGGEVYLRLGRGHYVYTSYAWFRQLPAGVPGAYRLFANLLSLPKANQSNVPAKRRWRFRRVL